jgi:acetyl esterase
MQYVWDAYLTNEKEKNIATAVPMSASLDVLENLPPALIITAESDVLRTEGELYAKKLTKAGVDTLCVRYLGIGHGFVTMPDLRPQAHAAIEQTVDILRKHWNSQSKL